MSIVLIISRYWGHILNLLQFLGIRKKIQPETFYEQLAQDGLLMDYLRKFLEERMANDIEFKNEMYEILLKYSKEPIIELERFYLEKMIESLSYFLEYTSQWRQQEH